MGKLQTYTKYCTGCGLCNAVNGTKYGYDEKGFYKPELEECDIKFCEQYCPASGKVLDKMKTTDTWGFFESLYVGWSSDEEVRFKASSGGILTGISLYLLEMKKVDGIIHVGASDKSAIETDVSISYSAKDVIERCGSRYTVSSPLIKINEILSNDKRYAFIGKPCDVYTLRQYLESDSRLKSKIPYLLSFFCAGMPSLQVNRKLLSKLNCTEENCEKLVYRGNGWPGYAIANRFNDVTENSMTYAESWGSILGRDINPYCRFCFDGVGCFADITCGDAWYRNDDGSPDFSEHQGRNVIFGRNVIGKELIEEAAKAGYISISSYDINELEDVQNHQFNRKKYLYPKLLGMKMCHKSIPYYKLRLARKYSKVVPLVIRFKITLGMIKRIIKGIVN